MSGNIARWRKALELEILVNLRLLHFLIECSIFLGVGMGMGMGMGTGTGMGMGIGMGGMGTVTGTRMGTRA